MAPKRKMHPHQRRQQKRSAVDEAEIASLEAVLAEQAPPRGCNPLTLPRPEPGAPPTLAAARRFDDLPLSRHTREALAAAGYVRLTAIQRAALPHALAGRDVLGAAKTGSGKTLAFLVPLLEALYRARWGRLDGLGALVISPTRELAAQIFAELRKAGARHDLSAGLLTGGRGVAEEAARVAGMNVLVATPGRLLQHMDETAGFDASALRVLVLDEADRILDLGFAATVDAVLANLPQDRQTLLFSATQTKRVRDLARLSLRAGACEYVAAHADAAAPTPLKLDQAWMPCPLPDKLDVVWSFIRSHLRARTIVFFATCKQVRFAYEALRRLRPGVPLKALHGHMGQARRAAAYDAFCRAAAGGGKGGGKGGGGAGRPGQPKKPPPGGMVLFATDVAARGLDFPGVDWVVQADAPEDAAAYVHRVGRTARYTAGGRALLLLAPSEAPGMLAALAAARVPLKQLRHDPAKVQPVGPALQALLSKDAELKEAAQRAVAAYLKSVFLAPNKAVFDVGALPAAEFAESLGLPAPPRLRFLKRARGGKAGAAAAAGSDSGGSDPEGEEEEERSEGSGGDGPGSSDGEAAPGGGGHEEVEDEDDDLLVVKRRDIYSVAAGGGGGGEAGAAAAAPPPPAGAAAKKAKKKPLRIAPDGSAAARGARTVFDDDGRPMDALALLGRPDSSGSGSDGEGGGEGLDAGVHATAAGRAAAARAALAARDAADRAAARGAKKAAREAKRARRLAALRDEAAGGGAAFAGADGGSGSDRGGSSSDGGAASGSEDSGVVGDDWDSDLGSLLDSDDDGARKPAAKRAKPSAAAAGAAYIGMRPAAAGGRRRGGGSGAGGLPVEEQEALALRLLRGGG